MVASLSSAQTDFTVGVSPSIIEIGDVDRGSVSTVKFNVITPSEDPILITMGVEPGRLDFFSIGKYSNLIDEFSEEDATGWVRFIDNPIEVGIDDRPDGADFGNRGWREVRFLLQIPEDAEPGWHVVKLIPTPTTPSEIIGQAGARVVSLTSVNLLFRVEGEAKRDGFILDVVPGEYVGNRLEVNTHFQNTGTVTISTRGNQEISDSGDSEVEVTIPRHFVGPGDVRIMKSYITGAVVGPGDYSAETEITYTTGSVSKSTSFQISDAPPEPVSAPEGEFPYLLVIIIIMAVIIISIVIYKWYK